MAMMKSRAAQLERELEERLEALRARNAARDAAARAAGAADCREAGCTYPAVYGKLCGGHAFL